jgi:ABC-type Fe3+ transport system permease subunit
MLRLGGRLIFLGGVLLALAILVIPLLTALTEAAGQGWSSAVLSQRDWRIFGRGCLIAALAALSAQIPGAALAMGLFIGGRSKVPAFVLWGALAVLLTPPYVYAYAWSLPLLPGGVISGPALESGWVSWAATYARAVWCLACWTAPLAAAFLGLGWRAGLRPLAPLIQLDGRTWRVWRDVAAPIMTPWVGLSLLATFVVAVTEYSVCHLCLVRVWNTEILASVQVAVEPGRAVLLAWPLAALALGGFILIWLNRRRVLRAVDNLALLRNQDLGSERPIGRSHRQRLQRILPLACVVVLWGLPLALLLTSLRSVRAVWTTWNTFPGAWSDGLMIAAGSALAAVWLGIAVDAVLAAPGHALGHTRRAVARAWAVIVVAIAVIGALSPPALVGDAFAAAYVHVDAVRDSRLIVVFVDVARFGVIAIAALGLAARTVDRSLMSMAAVDGAGWYETYLFVRLRLALPAAAAAGMLVGLLALGEVAASQLVVPPQVHSLAVTMLNMIHYGRQDEVVAMTLYLMAFVAAAVGSLVVLIRLGGAKTQGQ